MQIICGNCGQQIELEETGQAASVRCPSCSHEIPLTESKSNGLNEDAGFAARARRLMSETIQIECDSCSLCLKIAKKMAGRRIRCPGCGYMINVPAEILDPEAFEEVKPSNAQEAELAAISQAASVKPAGGAASSHPHKPHKKTGMGIMPWLMLLLAACLVAGIVYGLNVMLNRPKPAERQATAEIQNSDEFKTPSAVQKASVQILSCNWQMFANPAGYFPAAPGRFYACVVIEITAAKNGVLELSFDNTGAFVDAGGTRYYAIGTELDARSVTPADVSRKPIAVGPGSTGIFRLIFDLPAVEFRGRLEIKGCNEILMTMPAPPKFSKDIQGDYAECMPRNLKPLQRDPIMRELQLHGGMSIIIAESKNGIFPIKIPQAKISGTAEVLPDSTIRISLEHAVHGKLSCRAILTEHDKAMIIFLGDKPMQQLIFQKQPSR